MQGLGSTDPRAPEQGPAYTTRGLVQATGRNHLNLLGTLLLGRPSALSSPSAPRARELRGIAKALRRMASKVGRSVTPVTIPAVVALAVAS